MLSYYISVFGLILWQVTSFHSFCFAIQINVPLENLIRRNKEEIAVHHKGYEYDYLSHFNELHAIAKVQGLCIVHSSDSILTRWGGLSMPSTRNVQHSDVSNFWFFLLCYTKRTERYTHTHITYTYSYP